MRKLLYLKKNGFEDSEFEEVKMPLAMKADITEMVEPYYTG